MNKKQIAALFICLLAPNTIAGGLGGLLPAYVTRLGADASFVGYFLSLRMVSFMAGAIAGGWIADRFQARKPALVFSGLGAMLALWFLSAGGGLLPVTLWVCLVWLLGGATVNQCYSLAGLSVAEKDRGKVFGFLATTVGLGQLLGGTSFGFVVSRWGYPAIFIAAALIAVAWALPGLVLHDVAVARTIRPKSAAPRAGLSVTILAVVLAAAFAAAAINGGRLGTWLIMDMRGLGGAPIAATVAIGGAVSMPIPLFMGWLSDKYSRRLLLAVCYGTAAAGLVILAPATGLWQFGLVAALLAIAESARSLGIALVTDLADKERLGTSLSLLSSGSSIGGVLGNSAAGSVVGYLGVNAFLMLAPLVPLVAIMLLAPAPQRVKSVAPTVP